MTTTGYHRLISGLLRMIHHVNRLIKFIDWTLKIFGINLGFSRMEQEGIKMTIRCSRCGCTSFFFTVADRAILQAPLHHGACCAACKKPINLRDLVTVTPYSRFTMPPTGSHIRHPQVPVRVRKSV